MLKRTKDEEGGGKDGMGRDGRRKNEKEEGRTRKTKAEGGDEIGDMGRKRKERHNTYLPQVSKALHSHSPTTARSIAIEIVTHPQALV
jgi:hypothetical protein